MPPFSGQPARAEADLHTRRCARHSTREAAARCPACGEYFCRECVVEHEGRLLCSSCLARKTARRARRLPLGLAVRRVCGLGLAVLVAWAAFYAVAALLLKLPPNFHDGTIWRSLGNPP
jgi:hypothetical protein